MQRGFTKLFNTIVTSTIWTEDNQTRILWITMLAISDQYGVVSGSVPGLAQVANISVAGCRRSIAKLEAPDPDSRTPDFDGRRIEKIDGGWRILNHAKYRNMLNAEERKEYNRVKQQESRQRRQQMSNNVKDRQSESALSAEAEAEAEAERVITRKSTRVLSNGEEEETVESRYMREITLIVGQNEMNTHGGLWRTRFRENKRAIQFAIEDFKLSINNSRPLRIGNKAAWLTDRYQRAVREITAAEAQ